MKCGIRQKLHRGEWHALDLIGYVDDLKTKRIEVDPVCVLLVRQAFIGRTRKKRKRKHEYLFNELMTCGCCTCALFYNTSHVSWHHLWIDAPRSR